MHNNPYPCSNIAVAEEGDASKKDGPTITVYDTTTLKPTTTSSMNPTQLDPTFESTKIVSMSFAAEAGYLCTLGGKPDWKLIIWNYERAKLLAMKQVSNGPPMYHSALTIPTPSTFA